MRSRRSPGSTRFADTFASRPGLPRVSRLPDRRAWSTTAVVAAMVGGIVIGATAITGGGSGPTTTTDVAYVPQSRPTVTPTVTITPPPELIAGPTKTTTVKGDPQQVVKTVVMPGVTITLPPTTVTATAVTRAAAAAIGPFPGRRISTAPTVTFERSAAGHPARRGRREIEYDGL